PPTGARPDGHLPLRLRRPQPADRLLTGGHRRTPADLARRRRAEAQLGFQVPAGRRLRDLGGYDRQIPHSTRKRRLRLRGSADEAAARAASPPGADPPAVPSPPARSARPRTRSPAAPSARSAR